MRINALGAACLVAGSLLAVGQPSMGWSQGTTKGKTGTISVAAEVGARGFTTEPTAQEMGKLLEYRDLKQHAVIERLLLSYTPADSFAFYQIGGRKLLDNDRSAWLRASRPGLYDFQARYDGVPHTFSTTARSLATITSPGRDALPTPRPDSVAWRAAPDIGPVRVQWDAMKMALGITPKTDLDFKAEYTRIGKSGNRPLSLSFAGPGGPTREFLEPIDQTVHDIRVSQGYANKTFQVVGLYAYSKFQNAISAAEVASPLNTADTPTGGAAMARVALPPDNSAHTVSFTGAISLPARTRVMGSASYARFSQSDQLLAQTSNSLLASNPLLVLPRSSFDGQTKTSNLNLSVNSRPTDNLTIAARYRSFDFSDQTAPFHIQAMAVSDQSVAVADAATTEHLPFTKDNSDVSASYRLTSSLSLTAGYAWEIWTRDPEVRSIAKTTETTPRLSVDYTGVDWLTLRGSYAKGTRRGNNYNDTSAALNFPKYRRFDMADRDRDRYNVVAAFTPTDQVNVSLTWQDWKDIYPVAYGTQSDKSSMIGADADWSPTSRFSMGAGYSVEDISYILKSRYKTGAVGSATYDNPSYIWFSVDQGKSTVWYLNFSAVVIPDKLDAGGSYVSADSRFQDLNYNPTTPTGGTVAQNFAATAYDFPEVWSRKQPMTLFLSYRFGADWAATVRYQMETYRQSDFRTQNPQCFNTANASAPIAVDPGCFNSYHNIPVGADLSTSIGNYKFMGNNYRPYDAGWLTFMISFRPSALPLARGRSAM